jgi:hypothetical protein
MNFERYTAGAPRPCGRPLRGQPPLHVVRRLPWDGPGGRARTGRIVSLQVIPIPESSSTPSEGEG